MSDDLDFTADKADQYLKFDTGITYTLTFLERLPDHEEFKLGKGKKAVPAPVYLVKNAAGKNLRVSITSAQLAASLANAEKALGRLLGLTLKITPEGDGTDRAYRVRGVPTEAGTIQKGIGGFDA